MDPDPDPGGPKTCGSDGSGSATLPVALKFSANVMRLPTLFVGKMLPASNTVAANFFDFALINLHKERIR
jgi:hypothetical protein